MGFGGRRPWRVGWGSDKVGMQDAGSDVDIGGDKDDAVQQLEEAQFQEVRQHPTHAFSAYKHYSAHTLDTQTRTNSHHHQHPSSQALLASMRDAPPQHNSIAADTTTTPPPVQAPHPPTSYHPAATAPMIRVHGAHRGLHTPLYVHDAAGGGGDTMDRGGHLPKTEPPPVRRPRMVGGRGKRG